MSLPYAVLQAPVAGVELRSRQGPRRNAWHHGTDWSVSVDGRSERGSIILPVAPGVVDRVCRWPEDCCGGYGTYVLIKHDDDLYSFYAHMDRADVEEGQEVFWTTLLGIVGDQFADFRADGCPRRSMVPHLHLEIRHADGSRYDVLQVLAAGGLRVGSNGSLERVVPFEYEEPRLVGSTEKMARLPEVIVGDPSLLLYPQDGRLPVWPLALGVGGLGLLVGFLLARRRRG